MSDLPDLDTTQIGFIAFWNAIDQGGVSSIDPSEATSASGLNSYTMYDNGFEGKYTGATGRQFSVRVKNDGWIIAWVDRTNEYNRKTTAQQAGYWDVLNDWSHTRSAVNADQHTLERAINDLRTDLSNSGAMTYAATDVGLYNYEHSKATGATWFSNYDEAGDGNGTDYYTVTNHDIIYTAGTDKYYVAAAVACEIKNFNSRGDFEGLELFDSGDTGNTNSTVYGTADVLGQGLVPNYGTDYEMTTELGSEGGADGYHSHACPNVLALWS